MKLVILVPALLLAASLHADTVTLFPVADTAIFSLNPDNNYGGLSTIPVGPIAKPDQVGRGLLKFDVAAALPPGAVVTNVTLRLRVAKEATGGGEDTLVLHRLLVDWGEGTKSGGSHGTDATAGEANWVARKLGLANWMVPGALAGTDFATAASGSMNWDPPGVYIVASTVGLATDVQAWLDNPALNQGWLLKSQTEATERTAKRVVTREGLADQRPRLVIRFTPPPVAAPKLTGLVLPDGTLELDCRINPGSRCELRALADLTTTNYTVLTNYSAGATGLEARFATTPTAAQRYYRLVETGSGN